MSTAIRWMIRNGVTANLLMIFILVAGALGALSVRKQIFPDFTPDLINISVAYPGATPVEVEEAVVIPIESRLDAIDEILEINATASQGLAVVIAEIRSGSDKQQVLDEVKSAVDRIRTFPVEIERPVATLASPRSLVVEVVLSGPVGEAPLKHLANDFRDDLIALSDISDVQVSGARDYEIAIEVSKDVLDSYRISLADLASIVRRESLELSGGDIETTAGRVLLRTRGRNETANDFREIVVITQPNGTEVQLGDIARVTDGFADSDLATTFNGAPAVVVSAYRVGQEDVLDIADAVRTTAEEFERSLPAGVDLTLWQDQSVVLEGRLGLLVRNGLLGLALVLIALTLFLELRLAAWTAIGIGISFVGAFALLALLDVSLNVISLFGFILALGIVVDDAIVMGENIFAEREKGFSPLEAAERGAVRIARPVIFAILTTVAAFAPLLFVSGALGPLLRDLPLVVIVVLLLSLGEALFILPMHLSHAPKPKAGRWWILRALDRVRARVDRSLQRFVRGPLTRAVRYATRNSGVVMAGATASILVCAGLIGGGRLPFSFLPSIQGETVVASLQMPPGTPATRTLEVLQEIESSALRAGENLRATLPDDHPDAIQNLYSVVGGGGGGGGPGQTDTPSGVASNVGSLTVELPSPELSEFTPAEFEAAWREELPDLTEARSFTLTSDFFQIAAAIQVELSSENIDALELASADVAEELGRFAGVFDILTDEDQGEPEFQLALRPEARSLGISLDDLASQVRGAFFGAEVQRLQRDGEEVPVYVRLPEGERDAISDLLDFRVSTPDRTRVPLQQVADVSLGSTPTSISRRNGARVVAVTADADEAVVTTDEVAREFERAVVPQLRQRHPEVAISLTGERQEQGETFASLGSGFALALLVIFALLAIPLNSYLQPLVIMAVIPFGVIGAFIGHALLGVPVGLFSLFGIIGLSGVVVNDSLVFMDFVRTEREEGAGLEDALVSAAQARFRPIFLTSVTTFLGISPLIFEKSIQAQFLTPTAVSLGFGILFATVLVMLVVPALAVQEDRVVRFFAARRDRSSKDLVLPVGAVAAATE
ncbi:MAG: efflux RND transporter permease subunit [Gemmatimonadota bacterium]|nr:efflux RND transporter permease subunit [Gemmatimonadota bacterium]